MKVAKNWVMILAFVVGVVYITPTRAQFFDAVGAKSNVASREKALTKGVEKGLPKKEVVKNKENVEPKKTLEAANVTAVSAETLEKAKEKKPMYYSTIGQVTIATQNEDDDEELIMLYMKNFNVYRSPSGRTRCSMRFIVLTTLPDRLSNISYRLKWPKMETTISFNDVEPSVENYYDYSLLGDGCYNMASQPNIVVNRCRAKGLTQQACAMKIRWITQVR